MAQELRIEDGEKVELLDDKNHVYKTVVWEVMKDGSILVAVPTVRGIPMLLHDGAEMILVFFRDWGKFSFRVIVDGMVTVSDVRYARLVKISDIDRTQRREYYRLPVRMAAVVCQYEEGMTDEESTSDLETVEATALETTETKDISVTGIAIETKRVYQYGEKYIIKLNIDEPPRKKVPIMANVEVVRTDVNIKTNMKQVGMRFFDQNKNMSELLAKYVLAQQQILVMRRRLVEGD